MQTATSATLGDMADMLDRKRLGSAVTHAREDLGWSKEEAARRAGIHKITWKKVEDGLSVRDVSLRAVEEVLGWKRGTWRRIAAGRAPDGSILELADESATPEPAGEPDSPDLLNTFEDALRFAKAVKRQGVDEDLVEEYRQFALKLLAEAMRPERPTNGPQSPSV